ncbi:MAG: NAD(P)/FAD-dependent oxidoreductase [Candidatus Hadarchaeales archaeon]
MKLRMNFDAVVVGGGPSGCFFAANLARDGWRVGIFEEHREVGLPWCCAGVVGVGGMRELGLELRGLVLEELRGAILYSPSGKRVELTRGRAEAWVIDRPAFDQNVADLALKAGAELHLGKRCRLREGLEVGGRSVGGKVIVGADGPLSPVARASGLFGRRRFLRFAQVEARVETDEGFAELYLGREVAPGFFGWVVPAGERARVGVGTWENPLPFLRSLLRRLGGRVRGRIPRPSLDVLPASRSERMVRGNILLVGDAAGQVKPLTKGGLYMGLSCSKLAAQVASKHLERGVPLTEYEREVERRFGEEFRLGGLAFSLFSKMGNRGLEFSLAILGRWLREGVLAEADFDHHSRLLKRLPLLPLRRPRFGRETDDFSP